MRFWVALLLAVFMPLQLSWSAVGAYCQHETDKNAGHFGHHSHEHHVSKAETSKQADSGKAVAIDGDCGACQIRSRPTACGLPTPPVGDADRSSHPAARGKSPGSSLKTGAPTLPENECDCAGNWGVRQGLREPQPARGKGRGGCAGPTLYRCKIGAIPLGGNGSGPPPPQGRENCLSCVG